MYQITYYTDPAMSSRAVDSDTISDAALASYPVPKFPQTAVARHSDDASLTRYGYGGGWHARPPREAVEADRKSADKVREHRQLREAKDILETAGVRVLYAGDHVAISQDSNSRRITWEELAEAAEDSDIYNAILVVANSIRGKR